MGFLDFLKLNKKQNAEPTHIEDIFKLAVEDAAYRPLFYRSLLTADFYVVIFPPEPNDDETVNIKIRSWEDGKIPIFTSEDRMFDQNLISRDENYIPLNGRTIFENCPAGTQFVLNPYSVPSKEFTAEEIRQLLNGSLYQPDQQRQAVVGNNIIITTPLTYPTAMAEAIRKYCATRKEITGAYLALMEDTSINEAPHLIIGLEVKGNLPQIFGELNGAIKPHILVGEPVDMVDLSGSRKMSSKLKKQEYRLY